MENVTQEDRIGKEARTAYVPNDFKQILYSTFLCSKVVCFIVALMFMMLPD